MRFDEKKLKLILHELIDEAKIGPTNVEYSQHAFYLESNFTKLELYGSGGYGGFEVKIFGNKFQKELVEVFGFK